MQLVQSQGPNNWVRISQHMHYRSPKQCRERFHQNLKPSLNHEPITAEEGEMIEQMVAEMGKRWAEIARRLGNRSDNAVKNWWNGSMNRRRRNVIQSSTKTLSNRLEPIPATRMAPIASSSHRRHSYSRSWSGPPPSAHGQQLPFSQPNNYYASQYSAHDVYRVDSSRPTMAPINERRDQQLPGLDLPRPFPSVNHHAPALSAYSSSETQSRLPNPFSNNSGRPSMLLLPSPSQRQLDPPLSSPVGSEISIAPSLDRAPSLISDHNSTTSISPKTMHSPRPEFPGSIDTRSFRRGSAPSIETPSQSHHSDEGYISAVQSGSSDSKIFSSHMPWTKAEDSRMVHTTQWQRGHSHSHSASNPTLPPLMEHPVAEREPQSARDSRMTFSSLLN